MACEFKRWNSFKLIEICWWSSVNSKTATHPNPNSSVILHKRIFYFILLYIFVIHIRIYENIYQRNTMVKTEHSIIFVCNFFTWGGWLANCWPNAHLRHYSPIFFFLSSLVNRKYEIWYLHKNSNSEREQRQRLFVFI